jgi:hypothetical protein
MGTFIRLFVGLLLVQGILWGVADASHGNPPALVFLIMPAMWIAMIVGGVHSAGFFSFLVGIAGTSLFYAVLVSLGMFAASLLRKRNTNTEAGRSGRQLT